MRGDGRGARRAPWPRASGNAGASDLTVGGWGMRKRGVLDGQVVLRGVRLDLGAEPKSVLHPLGRLIDPVALRAIERALLLVPHEPVLAELRPDLLKQKPGPPDDRIGAKERVAMLKEIVAEERE